MKSGFVSIVGKTNVGKSSIINSLVGEKVAATANRPQTTRKAIKAIVNRPDSQIIFIDTYVHVVNKKITNRVFFFILLFSKKSITIFIRSTY